MTALIPDPEALSQFVDLIFKHTSRDGYVSFRAFRDNGNKDEKPILVQAIRLDDPDFIPLMVERARQVANWDGPAVFCPPVTTFKDHLNAKTDNIREGVDLSVECDWEPGFARVTLEALLGPPTVVVESGGEWKDPETGVIEPKLHLHWRLKTPTSTKEGHDLLKEARTLAARLVGGDGTNNSVVHPIRWPGSWHRKNTPRLAKIVASSDDSEIDLGEAVAVLREALGGTETGPHVSGDVRLADDASDVVSALFVIPNGDDPEVYHWTYWNNIGLKIWASTNGSEAGRLAFHDWSSKWLRDNGGSRTSRLEVSAPLAGDFRSFE